MEVTENIQRAKQDATIIDSPDVTILKVPKKQLLRSTYPHTLPVEIIEAAERTHALYLLATNPQAVLPPGKTMVSALAALQLAPSPLPANTLEDHVQRVIHRAFWDQATNALSSPSPAEQLTRIKGLQDDLLNEVKQLLPQQHPVVVSLSFPMSPTSDPLRSYALHLRSVAGALRTQCAPIRDAMIDGVLESLSDLSTSSSELAQLLVDATRNLFDIAKLMRSDLAHATIGRMDEVELTRFVRSQARDRERSFITEHWNINTLAHYWTSWRSPEPGPWTTRLVHALGSSVPVSCPFPIPNPAHETQAAQPNPPNVLPPHLFFAIPTLVRMQNALQTLTITACLRVLAGLASGSPVAQEFSARILAILKAEITPQTTNVTSEDGQISIANLADEVLSARVASNSKTVDSSEDQDQVIRTAVDRTLRAEDPTFKLLHRRLLAALSEALARGSGTAEQIEAPRHLVTGRLNGTFVEAKSHQLETWLEENVEAKGFEDACLREGAGAILGELRGLVHWEEHVWGDAMLDENRK